METIFKKNYENPKYDGKYQTCKRELQYKNHEWFDTGSQVSKPEWWLEAIDISFITEPLEREIKSLTANKNILELINQQNGELLAEVAKESNEKDKQIQELKEDVVGFANWISKNGWCVDDSVSVEHWLTNTDVPHTAEQLYSKYLSTKKQ